MYGTKPARQHYSPELTVMLQTPHYDVFVSQGFATSLLHTFVKRAFFN